MSDTIPAGYDYHVAALEAHAGLTCRFLKPADFTVADLPPETPDFTDGAQFMPIAVAMSPHGPMVFAVAARPAFGDGTVALWLDYICTQEHYPHSAITETRIGSLPAVTCDASQQADDGSTMTMRFVLLEDGGRLFQMSAMSPEMFWSAALDKMSPMLASLELGQVHGTRVPLFPGSPPPTATASAPASAPAPEPARAPAVEPTAVLTPDEFLALALADDAASLDVEHPMNANLRERGAGLVPRVVKTDLATRCATLAAGAVEGFFRVPFGWHVIDDGKRTLVFDAGGRIQINLSQRLHEGASTADFSRQLLQQYLEKQPDLPSVAITFSGIAGVGVRGVTVESETLDQYFLVRDLNRAGRYLVARVSASAEDSTRALDLAGDIVATFEGPDMR